MLIFVHQIKKIFADTPAANKQLFVVTPSADRKLFADDQTAKKRKVEHTNFANLRRNVYSGTI